MTDPSAITLENIGLLLGSDLTVLKGILANRSRHYQLRGRVTGTKTRILSVPNEQLKMMQSKLYTRVLRHISCHDAAYCCPGRGVLDAVQRHRGHKYLLHLDIKNFFPSVRPARVNDSLRHAGFSGPVAQLLTKLVTYRRQLPQGAPTSVAIGNMVLRRLDDSLSGLCRSIGLTYTRYVDDLAISGGSRLAKVEDKIRSIVHDCKWELGPKGGLSGPNSRPKLLGVLMGAELNIDPEYISSIEAVLNAISSSDVEVDEKTLRQVEGSINWIASVNPNDGARMRELFDLVRAKDLGG